MNLLLTNRQATNTGFSNDRNPDGLMCWTCPTDPAIFSNWGSVTATAFVAALTKPPLLFVHGFNNAEVKAEDMAVQIQAHIPDREVILFAWNSEGRVDPLSYERDRVRAKNSGPDIASAITLLGPEVDVICHSMGNWAMQHAKDLLVKAKRPQISHLAMVAADVNDTVLPGFKNVVRRGLVAFCRDDGALDGSTILHLATVDGLPRLGCTGPFFHTTPPNFSVIDCTRLLADERNPISKHSAYFWHDGFYQALNGFLAT